MRKLAPFVMIALAVITGIFTFCGDGSYQRLVTARRTLAKQESYNLELSENVRRLKHDVYGLNNSKRIVEKAARNELGMARPDEMIIVFDGTASDRSKENATNGNGQSQAK